jgi:hypothetical protein
MPSRATLALAGEFARDEAGPARWEQMHRALNRALTGATLEHRRATLALHAAHHAAAENGRSDSAQLDIQIAFDHLNEVTEVRDGLLALIRQVRSLAVAARQQAASEAARHG